MANAMRNKINRNVALKNYTPPEFPRRANPGDLFNLGRHLLLCADATDPASYTRLLDDIRAGVCLTDPPYGIIKHTSKKKNVHAIGQFGTHYRITLNDHNTQAALNALPLLEKHSKHRIIWGGNYFANHMPPSRCWLIWSKINEDRRSGLYHCNPELAYTSFDKAVKLYFHLWCGVYRAGTVKKNLRRRVHPHQKPVELLERILNDFTKPGETVLDPFGGSGSGLIACEATGRICYMMEYDPLYCDVIIDRYENFTGEKALLLTDVHKE